MRTRHSILCFVLVNLEGRAVSAKGAVIEAHTRAQHREGLGGDASIPNATGHEDRDRDEQADEQGRRRANPERPPFHGLVGLSRELHRHDNLVTGTVRGTDRDRDRAAQGAGRRVFTADLELKPRLTAAHAVIRSGRRARHEEPAKASRAGCDVDLGAARNPGAAFALHWDRALESLLRVTRFDRHRPEFRVARRSKDLHRDHDK